MPTASAFILRFVGTLSPEEKLVTTSVLSELLSSNLRSTLENQSGELEKNCISNLVNFGIIKFSFSTCEDTISSFYYIEENSEAFIKNVIKNLG